MADCAVFGNVANYQTYDICSFSPPGCTFWVDPGMGGGAFLGDGSLGLFERCLFSENDGGLGGALYASESHINLINCSLTKNRSNQGGGVYGTDSTITILNSTLAGNIVMSVAGWTACYYPFGCTTTKLPAIGAGVCQNTLEETEITNTIFANEGAAEIWGDLSISYSNIRGGWTGPGNIDADPRFLDIGIGDFRLAPDSPCIDSGTGTGLLADLEGNPRPIDIPAIGRDGTGDEFDMGAYEVPLGGFPTWTPTFTPSPTPTRTPTMLFDEFTDGRIDARDLLELFDAGKVQDASAAAPTLFHFSLSWRGVDLR
jgi:hypothetical protein